MRQRVKMVVGGGFLIGMMFVIIIHVVPIPIDCEYPAKQIRLDDPEYMGTCQLYIHGYYHFNLFTEDVFSGQVIVSDNRLTEKQMSDIQVGKDGARLYYSFREGYDSNGDSILWNYCLGIIFAKPLMHDICILAYLDESLEKYAPAITCGPFGFWDEERGLCIVASAESREEAIKIVEQYGVLNN